MKRLLVFLLLLFTSYQAGAQYEEVDSESVAKIFTNRLNRLRIEYTPPRGYQLFYIPHNVNIGMLLLTLSYHQLKAPKDSVFVYLAELKIDTSKVRAEKLKKFGLYHDPNQNYLKIAGRDTLVRPIAYDAPDLSKRKYNADRSGTYDLLLPAPYKGQYRLCKTLFIHKENRADVWLYFFYNPGSAKALPKHMAKISKTIKFLN